MDVASILAFIDEFSSAPHKPVQLVFGAEKKGMKMLVRQVPNTLLGESDGKARVKAHFRKKRKKEVGMQREERKQTGTPIKNKRCVAKEWTQEPTQARREGTEEPRTRQQGPKQRNSTMCLGSGSAGTFKSNCQNNNVATSIWAGTLRRKCKETNQIAWIPKSK